MIVINCWIRGEVSAGMTFSALFEVMKNEI